MRFLKQTFRSFWRYRNFSLINLLGLSAGIAATTLIFLIVRYEQRFDRVHSDGGDIYRVVTTTPKPGGDVHESRVPYPTARLLRQELPGVLATQINYTSDFEVKLANKPPVEEDHVVFADSNFFRVFDYALAGGYALSGDPARALSQRGKAVLTETTARKYFGNANPIGQLLHVENTTDVEVAAVIRDLPKGTHLPINLLVSLPTLTREFVGGLDPESFGFTSNGSCYVRAGAPARAGVVTALQAVVAHNAREESDKKMRMFLQPLDQVHFDPVFGAHDPVPAVSPRYLGLLFLIGGFILLIACINYINLSTSLAFSRSREVGVRKAIGASRGHLFRQYLSETFLLTALALALGIALALACLSPVNAVLGKTIEPRQLLDPYFFGYAFGLLLLIGFLSGTYPAMILSGFRPIESLKRSAAVPGNAGGIFRKALVLFQFTTSIALIICTLFIARQVRYFNSKQLGFNKSSVIEVGLPVADSARIEAFRARLRNQSGVQTVSFCLGAPISDNGISTSLHAPGLPADEKHDVRILACDQNYLDAYGIQLVAGRWFLPGEERNLGSGIVVNEQMVRTLGYRNPSELLGKRVGVGINKYEPVVIGVAKDFHTSSFHEAIGPAALMPFPYFYYAAAVRLEPGAMQSTMTQIEAAWRSVYPEYVYQARFIDDTLQRLYEEDERNYRVFQVFSFVSVFICCIGLWGLLAFVVVRKTKEIGIRKVLGASVYQIMVLLSKEFVWIVVCALLLAAPVAGYFMNEWLQGFAYRVPLSPWVLLLAGLVALVIAIVTISFQSARAAVANPIKNLRTE